MLNEKAGVLLKASFRFTSVFLFFLLTASLLVWSSRAYAQEAEPGGYKTKQFEKKVTQPIVKVLIKKIVVVGNSLLTQAEVDSVRRNWEGKELSFEDAKLLAAQLTMLYRQKGYFLVQAYIPYQRITNNTLQVNVLEGKLGRVTVEGNKHYSTKFILYSFSPATREKTLRFDTMEKYIMLLNENADLQVRSILQPGKLPGTTDVVLKIEDKQPNHIDVDYNNFGTLTGGENQPSVSPSFGNLAREGDMLSLKALYPFPSKSTNLATPIVTASYAVPVNNHGTKLSATYSSSDVRLGQALDVLNVVGNTNIVSFGVTQPLARSSLRSSTFTGTFNIKSAHNFTLNTLTSRDKIRDIALDYSTNWVTGSGTSLIDGSITQGLGTLFFGNPNNDPLSSAPYAGNQFTKLNLTGYRFQSLGEGGYLAIIKVIAQWSFQPLLSPEQFILGGPESVRGYRSAEVAGDKGVLASLEFRFPMITKPKSNLQFGVFFDAGRANNHNSTGAPGSSLKHLTGAGFGLRGNLGDATTVRADFGIPLDPAPNSTHESPVLYFDFSTRFL